MKYLIKIIILLSILIINFTCKDKFPVEQQKYPIVLTKEVETITDTGIIASAEILMPGEEKIIDAGFIWSENEGSNMNSSSRISLGSNIDETFETTISHDLCPDKNYFLRAYIITNEHTVYGNEVEFKSKGSKIPIITDIRPNKGVDGTKVVLSGENFSNYTVNNILMFNDSIIQIDSCTENMIYFTTPHTPISGTIKILVNVGCMNSIQEPDFIIVSPEINEIIPSSAYIGDTINIIGHNFNSEISKNKLFLDETEINIIYADTNLLKAIIPHTIPDEKELILKIGAKQIQTDYTVMSQWTQKASFPSYSIRNSTAFSIGNNIYLGFGSDGYDPNKKSWKYNTENDTWTQLNDFPGEERSSACSFSYNDKGYMLSGLNDGIYFNDFWEYNEFYDTWNEKQSFPGIARFDALGFIVEDKLYFGFGDRYNDPPLIDFWSYDLITETWNQLNDFPGNIDIYNWTKPFGFVLDGDIYIGSVRYYTGFDKNEFWKYNTQTNTWHQLNDYPGFTRYDCAAFSIGKHGYMGIGCGQNNTKDFWKYYPETDTWKQLENYPGNPQCGVISVSANGKAYVGLGMNYSFQYDFWEFIPNNGSNK